MFLHHFTERRFIRTVTYESQLLWNMHEHEACGPKRCRRTVCLQTVSVTIQKRRKCETMALLLD